VWRQVLVENAKTVVLESKSYIVRHTSRSKLREVDFRFENQMLRVSSRTQIQVLVGQKWHAWGMKLCNFSIAVATWPMWSVGK
jgi:hypothetical protein